VPPGGNPEAYQWAYEKNSWDSSEVGLSFSVGVFQWIPTTSGKKLKKSKTIRVKGYIAESHRVYEKAEELCRMLNAKGVRIDQPPKWLQKQYSVPKPADLVIERLSDDLTGAQVRAAREKVMERVLIPAGFVKGKGGTYVRQHGIQIHLIDFQASKYGHQYFINLGFHYSVLPGFLSGKKLRPAEYHVLDCGVSTRINSFSGASSYNYGKDIEELKHVFKHNATACMRVFDDGLSERDDPNWWLEKGWCRVTNAPLKIAGWHLPNLSFLECIAIYLKQFELAESIRSYDS
jgi:hypothetical protein